MEDKAISILDAYRTMAVSTVRSDGWSQTTIVGYANDGLSIYFLVQRSSQKYRNIQHDDRVSLAVGGEPRDLSQAKAVYAGAHASEVTDPQHRERAWESLVRRHPNLGDYLLPEETDAALMRAECKYVSVVDYSEALGRTDDFTVAETQSN